MVAVRLFAVSSILAYTAIFNLSQMLFASSTNPEPYSDSSKAKLPGSTLPKFEINDPISQEEFKRWKVSAFHAFRKAQLQDFLVDVPPRPQRYKHGKLISAPVGMEEAAKGSYFNLLMTNEGITNANDEKDASWSELIRQSNNIIASMLSEAMHPAAKVRYDTLAARPILQAPI